MITLRRDTERHHIQRGKCDLWLTFYPQDPAGPFEGGFGALIGLTELRLGPGGVVGSRPAVEAEIITYVREGALAQEDSTGSSGVVQTGEFQHLTTGRSIRHKETNASRTNGAHIIQIVLRPPQAGLVCAREQRRFTTAQRRHRLCVVASPDGRQDSLRLHQDALVYSALLDPGYHLVHELSQGRYAWLHIVYGEARLDGIVLNHGDGAGVTAERALSLTAMERTEILLIGLEDQPPDLEPRGKR